MVFPRGWDAIGTRYARFRALDMFVGCGAVESRLASRHPDPPGG
jgi:hypothetical protein